MSSILPIYGLPGMRAARATAERIIFKQYGDLDLAGGKYIDGSQSRDPGNDPDVQTLRCGMLMGRITAATFGTVDMYAPSIIGITSGAYTSGGTSLTVSPAQAAELIRVVGQSGTAELVAIGPPTANGTLAITDITHSAIVAATGVLTVTSLGVDKVAGTFIAVKDGRQIPRTFIPDGSGLRVTDADGLSITREFPEVPVAGLVISANFLPGWPSDTSLQAWIRDSLNTYGRYIFDSSF